MFSRARIRTYLNSCLCFVCIGPQEEIAQLKAVNRYVTIAAVLAGILALLGLFFAWYYKKKYQELKESRREAGNIDDHTDHAADKLEPSLSSLQPTDLDTLSPEELFRFMEHEIRQRELFCNPSFDRQTLTREYHISKERVGTAFSQGSPYDSLPQFINELRLEYASKLLVTTDLPITEVMAKAGFSNASVFSRYFSRKYQLSPTQYRRAHDEQ